MKYHLSLDGILLHAQIRLAHHRLTMDAAVNIASKTPETA
jgi:hypothetical protein